MPKIPRKHWGFEGAGDGTRTHDILLGKQTLYQLSYTRIGTQYSPATESSPDAIRVKSGNQLASFKRFVLANTSCSQSFSYSPSLTR